MYSRRVSRSTVLPDSHHIAGGSPCFERGSLVAGRPEERAIDAEVYRSVFRGHPAGVVVITADAGQGPAGFTATSLVSLSLHPPLVTFSVATEASSWLTVGKANSVVINFLSVDQAPIADRFAARGVDRFAEPMRWSRLRTGEPVLDDAPGYLRALVAHRLAFGDHHLIVARLIAHAGRRDHEPLIYHDGQYVAAAGPSRT